MSLKISSSRHCCGTVISYFSIDDLIVARACSKMFKEFAERFFGPALQKWQMELQKNRCSHVNVFEKLQRIMSFAITCRRPEWVETICLIYKNHIEWFDYWSYSKYSDNGRFFINDPFEQRIMRANHRDWNSPRRQERFTVKNDETVLPPLHQAAFIGHAASITVLLKHGAKVNYVYKHNYKVFREIRRSRHDNVDYEDRTENFGPPLFIACSRGHYEAAQTLLENRADVNGYSISVSYEVVKRTPLFAAIRREDRRMAALLLQHGASVNMTEGLGFGPTAREFDKKGILNQSGCCAIL